jgi:enolase
MKIKKLHAREILDSRGNPTVEVVVYLENGINAKASAPSGASTGSKEALELRDCDKTRYFGKGVLKAVSNINTEIDTALKGMNVLEQKLIDKTLIELDGTENKARLGSNAILSTSLAVAHAAAKYSSIPLFQYILKQQKYTMPIPMMNIINGGMHADNLIDIQEFMIVPVSAKNAKDSIRVGAEVFYSLKKILSDKKLSTNVGDEGGFAPSLRNTEEAIELILESIEIAGYKPGLDVSLALDVAASELFRNNKYIFGGTNKAFTSDQLISYYQKLVTSYPIISIEDPMAENDHEGWINITSTLGNKLQIVGDDLFVTNEKILRDGIANKQANAILIKPNQIGTLTETYATIELAQKSNYKTIISHRSGETEDTTIAHIAVAFNAGQIKTGSLCRTDRVAKYNELIRIEEYLEQ